MSSKELLERIIEDIEDTIDDYKDDIKRTDSRLTRSDRISRIDELKNWKQSLKDLLLEVEE